MAMIIFMERPAVCGPLSSRGSKSYRRNPAGPCARQMAHNIGSSFKN